jgi:hypothetical protein
MLVVLVLGGTVYVGMSGHDKSEPDTAPTPPRAAALATSSPPTAEPPRTPETSPDGAAIAYRGVQRVWSDRGSLSNFAVSLTLDGKRTISNLEEFGPRWLHVGYLVPLPVPEGANAVVQLVDTRGTATPANSYGTWTLPALVFNSGVGPVTIVDVVRQPQPFEVGAVALVQNGYGLKIALEPASSFAVLNIDVTIGSDPVFPDERYDVIALVGRKVFSADIDMSSPGVVYGSILFDEKLGGKLATLQVRAIPPNDRYPGPVVVKTYEVTVPESKDQLSFVNDTVGPDIRGDGLMGIIANGYSWRSNFLFIQGKHVLVFVLMVNPAVDPVLFPVPPQMAVDDAAPLTHRWVTGDDGLVGWPSALASSS